MLVVVSAVQMYREASPRYRAPTITKIAVAVTQVLPLGIGGLSLLFADEQGLYWVAAGALLVIIGSVANAWVLLVEILR